MTKKEKKGLNNNVLIGIIVGLVLILLLTIGVMGFFLGKNLSGNKASYEDLTLTIITDSRDTTTPVDKIVDELKTLPSIQKAKIKELSFSDTKAKKILKENELKYLPAFIFSTKNFDVSEDPQQVGQNGQMAPKINAYLQALPDGQFHLNVGANFDPFIERSERGFRMISKENYDLIKKESYIDGEEADLTLIEYSDLECPFCIKHHNAGTLDKIKEKEDINFIFNHFPLYFHENAQAGAEILECLAEQKGSEAFYALINKSFKDEKSGKEFLIEESEKLGADKEKLAECLTSGKYTEKVENQMLNGTELFGVTGTPGNIIINNETLEFDVISGALPVESFNQLIEKLKN